MSSFFKLVDSFPPPIINQQVNPWDALYIHFLGRMSTGRIVYETAAKQADEAMREREKRFPLQIKVEGKITDGQIV